MLAPLLLLCTMAGFGCQQEESISRYRVARLESQPAAGDMTPSAPQRMLAAVVPHEDRAWFFKIMGPDEPVAALAEPFVGFLKTLKFSPADGAPTWQLPEGWSRSDAEDRSGMRFATIQAGSQELTVIPLPAGETREQTVLSNINRWRGQVGLKPVTTAELKDSGAVSFEVDGHEVTMVNLYGTPTGGMSGAPFAGGLTGTGGAAPPRTDRTPPAAGGKLKYEVPAGWTERPASGMRKAAFEVKQAGKSVEITVIDLAAAAGARLPNVNRWRGQIGLKAVTQEELDAAIQKIDMGGTPGDYVVLVGPEDADKPETILGVIAEHGGKSWFVKLHGSSELAAKEKERFEQFARSLRF
ncbi:MAG: hypothetical protein KDA79_04365 [Planctomycetaceae bacterium]|nr:hypothetical protein [Planctomycetaceae bacterium]